MELTVTNRSRVWPGTVDRKAVGRRMLRVCSFEGTWSDGPVAQLVRAPPCHGGGHGFESRLGRSHKAWTTSGSRIAECVKNNGILAQLGEHLPYKQRVTGSSPVGPIFCFLNKITCRSGGTGRRPGLKIPWVVIPVPVRFRSAADYYMLQFLEKNWSIFPFTGNSYTQCKNTSRE